MREFNPSGHTPDRQLQFLPETPEDQLPTIGELWAGVVSNRWVVGICLLLGILAGLYKASAPKRYTSAATIRIQPSNGSVLSLSASQALSGGNANDEKINTELAIMNGRTILLKVAKDLHLNDNVSFWGGKVPSHLDMTDPSARDQVLRRMRGILIFVRQPKSDIVIIAATTSSPVLSADIPNTVTNEYIARIFQVRYGSTERVSTWLSSQLNDLKDRVERDQEQLVGLQDKLGVLGLDQKSSTYLLADSLAGITRASSEATIQRIIAEAKLKVLQDSDPNLIEGEQPLLQGQQLPQNGLLQTLRAAQADAAANYANLTARLGPSYPDVKQAKARLDELNRAVTTEQQRILNQAQISYSASAANEKMTSDVLSSLKTKAFAEHDDMVRFVVLQRQYEADRILYESLMERLRVASINAGLESAQVDIVDPADIPSIPKKPLPYQWFIALTVAGAFLGLVLAILIDRLDTRLRKPIDAERLLNIPLLSNLHRYTPDPKARLAFNEIKGGAYAEGLQILRSSILMSKADKPPGSILVTSSIAGEGKSTVSRGLAAMLAMHGSRVLLIDADLHRPTQSGIVEPSPVRGLSDVLTSSVDPRELIVPVSNAPGLFLLASGKKPPQPATLLSSNKMSETVGQMKELFDFVVIDSPPVLLLSDTVLCASLVEIIVLVVREDMAELKAVKETIGLLRRAGGNVVGFVMNATTHRGGGYGSYYTGYGEYGRDSATGGNS